MPRRRTQPQRPVRYAAAEHDGRHQVVDQLHGYTLGSHPTATAAEDAVRELTANPTAAIEAVEELDAAQRGRPPPSTGSCAGTGTPGACARMKCCPCAASSAMTGWRP
ncbi:hypothetical protein ACIP6Q_32200 [Streptomyces bobili]|uniref:hypothetical protein n=1 Tax=Streptomyces bobili TaxID=67280 RepID=UPI003819EE48